MFAKKFAKKRKTFLFAVTFATALFSVQGAFAQSDMNIQVTSRTQFPKKLFVGDVAELTCWFHSNIDFFANDESIEEKILDLSRLPFESDNADFTLQKAVLRRNALTYSVSLTVLPWKPGSVQIPEFDLFYIVFASSSAVPCTITFEPIEVSSILPKGNDASLRRETSPLLIPGTSYVLYAVAILFVILVAVASVLFARRAEIYRHIQEKNTLRLYAKNARNAIRRIKKLLRAKPSPSDGAFCENLEKILRNYLSVRFGTSFAPVATSEVGLVFERLFPSIMSESFMQNVSDITAVFMRCDYVRYAKGSLDSKRLPAEQFEASLKQGERAELCAECQRIIRTFESGKDI